MSRDRFLKESLSLFSIYLCEISVKQRLVFGKMNIFQDQNNRKLSCVRFRVRKIKLSRKGESARYFPSTFLETLSFF